MKEQIKKMRDEFFDALEPDSCVAKGNYVYGEEGCPFEQRKCDEVEGCPSHQKESQQPQQCEEDEQKDSLQLDHILERNDASKSDHNRDDKAIKPNTEGQTSTLFIDMAKLYKDVTAAVCTRYAILINNVLNVNTHQQLILYVAAFDFSDLFMLM